MAALALVASVAFAQTTNENGYEVTRSQTVVPVPHGRVGRKTIDRETRTGNTEATDGNSLNVTLTIGGFMNRCPLPEGNPVKFVVPGDFEFSVVVDSVDTDVVPTERKHHEKRMTARIKVFVNDDLTVSEGEIAGEFTSHIDGVRTGPVRLHKRFPIKAYGVPDFDTMLEAVTVTGDMAAAALMWNASTTIMAAQAAWREPNACAELVFDPPSESRSVSAGETVEIKVKVRTRDGQLPVPKGIWDASVVQGGRVAEPSGRVSPDGTFVVRYVGRTSSSPKTGDGARIEAVTPAGIARDIWKIRTGLTVVIEHRLMTRRNSSWAITGHPIYDGSVRVEIPLEPFPTIPGEYRGDSAQVVRQFTVGHVTPRCAGQGTQTESWRARAIVDAATGTMQLGLDMYVDDMEAFWVCDGQRDEVTANYMSDLDLMKPLSMPSRSGSRQTFNLSGDRNQETLTVTIP